MKATT